jgi:hypothetical protein
MINPKGCLTEIESSKKFPGTSPRKGFFLILTLKCGHTLRRCYGFYLGRRVHCPNCIKNREVTA